MSESPHSTGSAFRWMTSNLCPALRPRDTEGDETGVALKLGKVRISHMVREHLLVTH